MPAIGLCASVAACLVFHRVSTALRSSNYRSSCTGSTKARLHNFYILFQSFRFRHLPHRTSLSPDRVGRRLVIPQRILSLRTARGRSGSIYWNGNAILWTPYNVIVIPGFRDDRPSRIVRPITSIRLIVPWSPTANVWNGAGCFSQRALNVRQGDLSGVARCDVCSCEPLPCRVSLVVLDGGLEEIDYILVLGIIGTKTWHLRDCQLHHFPLLHISLT